MMESDLADHGWTILGALEAHVRTKTADFQPMNANFGILRPLDARVKGKQNRYEQLSKRAIETLSAVKERYDLNWEAEK